MFNFRVNFYLHKDGKQKNQEYFIYCYVRSKGNTITLKTTKKIPLIEWEVKKQKVRRNSSFELEYNSYLDKFKLKVEKLIHLMLSENIDLTFDELKERIKERFYNDNKTTFIELFDNYIVDVQKYKSKSNYGIYTAVSNHLKQFVKKTNYNLNFYSINQKFYDLFFDYLGEQEYQASGINKYFDKIISFMNYAEAEELHDNKKYRRIKKESNGINSTFSITESELQLLENSTIPKELESVRNMFLLLIYTAQRFNDLLKFYINHVNGDVWHVRQSKGKKVSTQMVEVKLNQKAIKILSQFNYKIPQMDNQSYNNKLREVCRLSGLNTPTREIKKIGRNEVETIKPKFELITSHVGRHTYITISKSKGINDSLTMLQTGHKDLRTYNKYFTGDTVQRTNTFE